jgi:Cdc6-like AAA superfamily ATPase
MLAIAGAGKTKLSSKVVDSLLDELGKGVENMALGYFYCDRNRDDHRDPVAVLRSIVRQISAPRDESTIIACVEHAYMERKRSGFAKGRLTSEECQDLLLDLVDSYSQTTVVIDGLDECEPQMRHILMDVLDTMLARSSRRLKIFIASRKDQDLKDRYLAGLEVTANDNQADIEKFVLDQMERSDFFKKKLSTHVRQEVLRTFHDKSQGM